MKDSIPSPTFFHKERAAAAALFLCVIEPKCICEAYVTLAKSHHEHAAQRNANDAIFTFFLLYLNHAYISFPLFLTSSVKYHLSTLSSSPVTGFRYLIKSEL